MRMKKIKHGRNSLNSCNMYERVAKFVTKHQLHSQFEPRFDRIVNTTSGMGWGFHDALTEIYHEHLGESG